MNIINCKICNSDTDVIHDRQYGIDYFHCSNCDFIFQDPASIVSNEDELKEYKLHENTLDNVGYVNIFRKFIAKTVTPYNSGIKTALDFGSGPGPVLAHLLKEEGFNVDIYDPFFSPEKIYENSTYDLITSTEVFEHFKAPLESFEIICNSLNPSGILAIMTHYHPQDNEKFKNWWYRLESTHISFYSHITFEHLAEKFGMKILMMDEKNLCAMVR